MVKITKDASKHPSEILAESLRANLSDQYPSIEIQAKFNRRFPRWRFPWATLSAGSRRAAVQLKRDQITYACYLTDQVTHLASCETQSLPEIVEVVGGWCGALIRVSELMALSENVKLGECSSAYDNGPYHYIKCFWKERRIAVEELWPNLLAFYDMAAEIFPKWSLIPCVGRGGLWFAHSTVTESRTNFPYVRTKYSRGNGDVDTLILTKGLRDGVKVILVGSTQEVLDRYLEIIKNPLLSLKWQSDT